MTRDVHQWHDEIALREASLADARREHAAGELSDEEFVQIEERETRALARARAALEAFALTAPSVERSASPRRRRTSLLLVALVCFVVVLVTLLVAALTFRQPGTSGTGSITLDPTQRVQQLLGEAATDTFLGHDAAALAAYAQVLSLEPTNVTALTQTGWLDFTAGSAAKDAALTTLGVADMRRAIAVAPTEAAARLNYAMAAALTPGNRALAVREFRVFLTLSPSSAQLAVAAPYLTQLHITR